MTLGLTGSGLVEFTSHMIGDRDDMFLMRGVGEVSFGRVIEILGLSGGELVENVWLERPPLLEFRDRLGGNAGGFSSTLIFEIAPVSEADWDEEKVAEEEIVVVDDEPAAYEDRWLLMVGIILKTCCGFGHSAISL